MVVGDDDLGLVQFPQHVGRHQFTAGVVAVGVVGLEHPQAVADSDAWCHHQEALSKARAVRAACGIHRLPSDDHGHHRGLAGASGELEGHARQTRVGLLTCTFDLIEKTAPTIAEARSHLCEPDSGLHRLHLAEKRADASERMMPPVLQQPGGFGRHSPLSFGQLTPSGKLPPKTVDQIVQVVLLAVPAKRPALRIKGELFLLLAPCLARLRNRRDERHLAPPLFYGVRRLPPLIQHPMPGRNLVGRVEDGGLVKDIRHGGILAEGLESRSWPASLLTGRYTTVLTYNNTVV